MRSLSLIILAWLPLACTPKPADTAGDETGTTTDGGGATDSATSTTAPTTSATTTGTTEGPGATVTTDAPTTGEPAEPLPAACDKMCAMQVKCGLGQPPGCEEGCIDSAADGCEAELAAEWECVAALPCPEFKLFLMGLSDQCQDQLQSYDLCTIPDCTVHSNGDAESCLVGLTECMGVVQQMRCEGDTCTCFEDDVAMKTCENAGFCASLPGSIGQEDAEACCGWTWP